MMIKLFAAFILFNLIIIKSSAQNVGIGTASPAVKLDVNGAIGFREGTPISLTNTGATTNDNVALGTSGFYRIIAPATAAFTITGFTNGTDGRILILSNQTGQNITISNNSANSLAGNRIATSTGNDLTALPSGSSLQLQYNATLQQWVVTSIVSSVTVNKTIIGTTNQVNAAATSSTVTLSLPQSIATTSSPQFAGLNLTGLSPSLPVYTDASSNLTTTPPVGVGSSYWTLTGANLYPTTLTDVIGIGTTTPATNAALAIKNGHIESQQTTAPTTSVGAALGLTALGASASVSTATDVGGAVKLVVSLAGGLVGAAATINFNKAYVTAPIVVICPTDIITANAYNSIKPYVSSTTTSFTINFGSTPTAALTYNFNYIALETH